MLVNSPILAKNITAIINDGQNVAFGWLFDSSQHSSFLKDIEFSEKAYIR